MKKIKFIILLLFPLALCAQDAEQSTEIPITPIKQNKVAYHFIVDAGVLPIGLVFEEVVSNYNPIFPDLLNFHLLLSNNIILNEKYSIGIGGGVHFQMFLYGLSEGNAGLNFPIYGNFRYYFKKISNTFSPFINVSLGTSLNMQSANDFNNFNSGLYTRFSGGFKGKKFQANFGLLFTAMKWTDSQQPYFLFEIGPFVSFGIAL